MPRLYRKSKKIGLPPGTLQKIKGENKIDIDVIDYDQNQCIEEKVSTVQEAFKFKDSSSVSWINIIGRNAKEIEEIDRHFGIHPLVLEDIINLGQRPKIEEYGKYLFLVTKMVYWDKECDDLYAEQVSFVLGKNYVLSFQEKVGDVFDPVRLRIRQAKGRIRKSKEDYLAYALLDAIVDHYFVVLEQIGERIDQLEESILENLDPQAPAKIHKLKTQIIYLRKQIWPLREVLAYLERIESTLVSDETKVFIRDVYDHAIQVNDTLEAFRDALSGLHDIYLSSVSNRMNEVMQVLTIFAAIFIPLGFIAGLYGMNFKYIPELEWDFGYFYALGLMASVVLSMLVFFKIKKWM